MKKPVLHPDLVPKEIDKWTVDGAFKTIDGEGWRSGYFKMLRSLEPIGDSDFDKFYPIRNEHNRERAMLLVKGGNFVTESILYRLVLAKSDDSPKVLYKCLCVPSQKSSVKSANVKEHTKEEDGYHVFLCFDYDKYKPRKILPYPYSCCGCYDGRNSSLCSHLLGFSVVLMLAQHAPSQSEFEWVMPDSPLKIQMLPLLIENMVRADKKKRSEGRTLAWERQHSKDS